MKAIARSFFSLHSLLLSDLRPPQILDKIHLNHWRTGCLLLTRVHIPRSCIEASYIEVSAKASAQRLCQSPVVFQNCFSLLCPCSAWQCFPFLCAPLGVCPQWQASLSDPPSSHAAQWAGSSNLSGRSRSPSSIAYLHLSLANWTPRSGRSTELDTQGPHRATQTVNIQPHAHASTHMQTLMQPALLRVNSSTRQIKLVSRVVSSMTSIISSHVLCCRFVSSFTCKSVAESTTTIVQIIKVDLSGDCTGMNTDKVPGRRFLNVLAIAQTLSSSSACGPEHEARASLGFGNSEGES